MLAFLRNRAIDGVETVTGDAYARTVAIRASRLDARGTHRGPARAAQGRAPRLRVAVARARRAGRAVAGEARVRSRLRSRRRRVGARPPRRGASRVARPRHVRWLRARRARGRRPAGLGARRAHGARADRARVRRDASRAATAIRWFALFPTAARIAALAPAELARLGVTPARARTARRSSPRRSPRAASGSSVGSDVEATVGRSHVALPGIGAWTANYIAMRALRWPDAFLANDLVVLKALGETRPARALRRERGLAPLAFLRRHAPVEKCDMKTAVYYDCLESPLGTMVLATDGDALDRRLVRRPAPPAADRAGLGAPARPAAPAPRRDGTCASISRASAGSSSWRWRRPGRRSSAPCGTRSRPCRSAPRSRIASLRRGRGGPHRSVRRARRPGAIRCRSSSPAIGSSARTAR